MPNAKAAIAARVDRAVRDKIFPTKGAIARAIGMSDSGFSRAVQDKDDKATLTVEQAIRLAAVLGADVGAILRDVGRAKLADFLDQQFRRPAGQLNAQEVEFVNTWREATPGAKHAVNVLLRVLKDAQSASSGSPSRGPGIQRLRKRLKADDAALAAASRRLEEMKTTPSRAGSTPRRGPSTPRSDKKNGSASNGSTRKRRSR